MDKHEGGFFWGVVVGAVAVAIAGGVILARSFRSYSIGIDSWEDLPKSKPAAGRGKAGAKRRPTARK